MNNCLELCSDKNFNSYATNRIFIVYGFYKSCSTMKNLTPRKIVSSRKWKKPSSKDRKKTLSILNSESVRDVRGHTSTSSNKKEAFSRKRPSSWDLSEKSIKTQAGVKLEPPSHPVISKLPLDRIKSNLHTSDKETSLRDVIKRPVVKSSTECTDEEWFSTESTSDFLHLKEKLESRNMRSGSLAKQDLLHDLKKTPVNWVPQPPSDFTESTETACKSCTEEKWETRKGLEAFLNISTLNIPQTDKENMQMSIWKIPTRELHQVTLKDFISYSFVAIHNQEAPYTYVQTVKHVPRK